MSRRAPRILPLLLTGLVTAGTVGFAPSTAPAAEAASLPDVRVTLDEDGVPVTTVAGMADRLGLAPGETLGDPASREDRVRRLLAADGHETVRAIDVCDDECEPGEEDVETFTGSFATDDLDGDGTDDVLVLEETYDWTTGELTGSTAAHSGADGSILWSRSEPGFHGAVPDVDGDGLPDLLSVTFEFASDEDAAQCTTPVPTCDGYAFWVEESMTLTTVSGVTGAQLSATTLASTYEESVRVTDVPVPNSYSTAVAEIDVTLVDMVLGLALVDTDGDGAVELVVDRSDGVFTIDEVATINDTPLGYADLVAARWAEDLSSSVVAIDLATGDEQVVRTDDGAILIVDSVKLDGASRLLLDRLPETGEAQDACAYVDPLPWTCAGDEGVPGTGSTADGATRVLLGPDLEPLWEVPLDPTSFFAIPAGGDLDGDGADDLFDLRTDLDTLEDQLAAMSGATGADLWSADSTFGTLVDGAVLTGAATFHEDEAGRLTAIATARRLDAATGALLDEALLASAELEAPDPEDDVWTIAWIGLAIMPLIGTGPDVLGEAGIEHTRMEEVCETWEEPDGTTYDECWYEPGEVVASSSQLAGVDGADLTDLFRRSSDQGAWVLDAVDLDGDATAELLVVDLEDWTLRAERLDGTVLWTLPETSLLSGVLASPAGPAVLVDDVLTWQVEVRDGDDLDLRWSAPLG